MEKFRSLQKIEVDMDNRKERCRQNLKFIKGKSAELKVFNNAHDRHSIHFELSTDSCEFPVENLMLHSRLSESFATTRRDY